MPNTRPSENQKVIEAAVWYLESWIGTPYLWGGDDFSGFDCSGLNVEVLKSVGWLTLPDVNANGLLNHFRGCEVEKPQKGCMVFFVTKKGVAVHTGMMRNDFQIVHAAGGGRKTDTLQQAIDSNAFIKPRSLARISSYREAVYSQNTIILDPFILKEDDPK